MATEPFDDMPKITLEKDDMESFRRSRGQSPKSAAGKTKSAPDPEPTGSVSRGPSWLVFITLLALLCGTAAYWSMLQYKALMQAQERITDLEQRLSATGEEMDQSTVALGVKVTELSKKSEELWEQMDKLWASAWRRNQTEIGDLAKALNSLKSSTDSNVKSLSAKNTDLNNTLVTLNSQLDQYANSLKQFQEMLNQVKQTTVNNEQQLASLREKLISTALGNNNLTNKLDDLELKLTALEKSLAKPATPPVTTP